MMFSFKAPARSATARSASKEPMLSAGAESPPDEGKAFPATATYLTEDFSVKTVRPHLPAKPRV